MNNIFELINKSNSIVILTHESPDGDAFGSSMAMYSYLLSISKNVDIIIPKYPKIFDFLPNINCIKNDSDKKYDLGIVVDTSTKERIGQINDIFNNCKETIVIDHHISNTKYANINYIVSDAPSCSQIIYYLLKNNNIAINDEIGTYLMTGVLTDTDGFKHNDVTEETFLMAADLKHIGVNIFDLYNRLLTIKSIAQYNLSKIVMDRLEFFENGKIAFSYINDDDMKKCGAVYGEHEGLVEIGRNIQGVEVSIFLREDDGKFKISLRSNGIANVNKIALVLGGAGHIMAAGATSNLSFKETKNKIIEVTKKELNLEK